MEKKKLSNKTKKILLATLLVVILWIWGFFAFANSFESNYKYLPFGFQNDQDVFLGLMAWGNNTATQYYPGGYAVYPRTHSVDGNQRRRFTKFEIYKPRVHADEIFSSNSTQPDINYIFEWKEPDAPYGKWRYFISQVPASKFPTGEIWVDVMPEILKLWNIRVNSNHTIWKSATPLTSDLPVFLDIDQWSEQYLTIRTTWADDQKERGITNFHDISKKFSFRALDTEAGKFGLAPTDKSLWWTDGKIPPEKMYQARFATVWVKSGIPNKNVTYYGMLKPGSVWLRFLTIDVDQARIDKNASPLLYNTYIDAIQYIPKTNGGWMPVDKHNQEITSSNKTIFMVAPFTDNAMAGQWLSGLGAFASQESIPPIGPNTRWDVWPSGSFDFANPACANVAVWDDRFPDCYVNGWDVTASIYPAYKSLFTSHPGITQHTILLGDPSDKAKNLQTTIHNISAPSGGNAFAIATDEPLWAELSPPPTDTACDPNDANAVCLTWVQAKTRVHVDIAGPNGSSYEDDGKNTAPNATHTYKTDVCNYTASTVNGVQVQVFTPSQTELIGSGLELSKSSVRLNGSAIDLPPSWTQISADSISGSISLGNLAPNKCGYITYQVVVDGTWLTDGQAFKVKNKFLYDAGSFQDTNEVSNQVGSGANCSMALVPIPISGSTVLQGDSIQYKVSCTNTSFTTLSGTIACDRAKDTPQTDCRIGDCTGSIPVSEILPGSVFESTYTVRVKDVTASWTILKNKCTFLENSWKTYESNETTHTVWTPPSATDCGWSYTFNNFTPRSFLLNSSNWNPRSDGSDVDTIQYRHRYTGTNIDYIYPSMSNSNGYYYGNVKCGPDSLPNYPNAYSHTVNTQNTSPGAFPGGSNPIAFSLNTTLPNLRPKTILYQGTLNPTTSIADSNGLFKSGWDITLPSNSTVHRAVADGSNGIVASSIASSLRVDRWQYVPYSSASCTYTISCWKSGCSYGYRSYALYRWEVVSNRTCSLTGSWQVHVDVGWSTAWFRTRNADVHTNQSYGQDGTSANLYDLGQAWYNSVNSAPKLYTPPGSTHGDYIVSSNVATTNLTSKRGWYATRNLKMGHGYVYDREKNPRDFYTDLLVKQLYWKITTMPSGTQVFRGRNFALNEILYYPWDLIIDDSADKTVTVTGKKATIIVGGNVSVRSNIHYDYSQKWELRDLAYLWLIVKWNVTILPNVTDTVGIYYIDGTLNTGDATQPWHHLGQIIANRVNFERKAPLGVDGSDINEPSEDLMFDDQIYMSIPPGFAELDDGQWALITNLNPYSGEKVDY